MRLSFAPGFIRKWLLRLTFASSLFVLFEPSLYDLALVILMGIILFRGRVVITPGLRHFCVLLAVFMVAQVASIVQTTDIANSAQFFGITLYLMLSTVVLAGYVAFRGEAAITDIFAGFYIGCIITFLAVFCAVLNLVPSLRDLVLMYGESRARGFFKDTNVMSPAMIPIGLYALAKLKKKAGFIRNGFHFGVFMAATFLIVLSFSRGAFITYVLGILIYFSVQAIKRGRKGLKLVMAGFFFLPFLIGGTIVALNASGYGQFLSERTQLESYDQDRFKVHEILLNKMVHATFGIGPGQTNPYLYEHYDFEGSNAAHNTYLRVGFENGVFGLLVYIYLLAVTLVVAYKSSRAKDGLANVSLVVLCSYVATLISALTVDTLHWRHFWIIIALVWGIAAYRYRVRRAERLNESKRSPQLGVSI